MEKNMKHIERASDMVEQLDLLKIARLISEFKYSDAGEKIRSIFEDCSTEDKKRLYESGKPGILNMAMSYSVPGMIRSMFRFDNLALKVIGGNIAPSYRMLVHLGVLDDENISDDEIIHNTEHDAKSLHMMIRALGLLTSVVAPEATPILATLKTASATSIATAERIAIESSRLTREEIYKKRSDLSETLLSTAV